MSFQVLGTAHTGITVVDLERSLSFWRDVLGLKVVLRDDVAGKALEEITGVRGGAMSFAILEVPGGGGQIELLEYTQPADRQHLRPRPFDVGSMHVALFVDDIEAVLRDCAAAGWRSHGTPRVRQEGPAKGMTFLYMSDPDGTIVELVQAAS
ncbi:VOC family protein [Amycolatopsis sp. NPDC023774]|uniref:VOC family protein n=1 Tax=Amycolatopsis sp. NPDC023774 TaxID=3155015 RepID=UPI00340C86E6